ncbi:MAG TPA: SRPBCC family protein [Mycobacterium sp.]|nr:SRPBCC family protein [Mycobacterium sp.]
MSWWTVHAERTLSEHVPAPPDAVRDFYVDLDNIKLVHPLIVSVETLSRGETPEGYQQTYRVVDRIPLGPLTIRTSYQARLRGRVSFEAVDGGTQNTERIGITAPRPLAAVTIREGVKAHVKMLAGIRSHFESGRTQ